MINVFLFEKSLICHNLGINACLHPPRHCATVVPLFHIFYHQFTSEQINGRDLRLLRIKKVPVTLLNVRGFLAPLKRDRLPASIVLEGWTAGHRSGGGCGLSVRKAGGVVCV